MATYASEVLSDAPRHYWRLNDAVGAAQLQSALGGGWPLYPAGSYTLASPGLLQGTSDASVRFTDGYAQSVAEEAAPNVFTIECVFRAAAGSGYLVGFSRSDAYDRHLYIRSDGTVTFGVFEGTHVTVTTPISVLDGKPHHLVARAAADGKCSIWIDGVKQAETTTSGVFFAYSPGIRIGSQNMSGWPGAAASMPFNGWIDEVAIYHFGLSDARIARHAAIAFGPAFLAGVALLDTGAAATTVIVRNWATMELAGSAIPDTTGAWRVNLPPGEYEVTARGPAGYRPLTHGPVVALDE